MKLRPGVVASVMLLCGLFGVSGSPASAATSLSFPHRAVAGFATATAGLSVVYEDGSVSTGPVLTDALRMNAPVVGGAPGKAPGSYWLAGADGGVFSFNTPFYGSMGNQHLNQPVSAIASTRSRRGYWLAARDGGVFSFGDATFYGSAGAIPLRQPIVGIQATPTGMGYRLVARDGGVFNYGDAKYLGSVPFLGVDVADVVGLATTRTERGYWIARSNGEVYAFGDANSVTYAGPSSCAPVTAIVRRRLDNLYQLIGESGACGRVTARMELPVRTMRMGSSIAGRIVVENDTGSEIHAQGCRGLFSVLLVNDVIKQTPLWPLCGQGITIPVGRSIYPISVRASYNHCAHDAGHTPHCLPGPNPIPPLPPGDYRATFFQSPAVVPTVAPIGIRVTP